MDKQLTADEKVPEFAEYEPTLDPNAVETPPEFKELPKVHPFDRPASSAVGAFRIYSS